MFRIQENLDGTTSIYCKNNGNLLCKIPTNGNSSVPRPVNVVGPQPSSAKWQQLSSQRAYPTNEKPPGGQSDLTDDSPLPSEAEEDLKEDLEDAGSQEGFLQCLDLVPRDHLQSTPREELLAEWPLRHVSRSRAFRYSWGDKEHKIHDQLPLTSYYGVRLLRMIGERPFAHGERLQVLLRAYESFCRHPYNTVCPTSCHFPKLRCREKKQYPITTPPRVLRHVHTAHTYSMGRRQREECRKTLKTGLDTRSRRLLKRFNATCCVVRLLRLPQREIDDWLSRRSPPSDEDDSDIEIIEADPTYKPSMKISALPPSRTRRGAGKVKVKDLPKPRQCAVYLKDVVSDIRRRNNTYYFKNTRIRVPFYRDFLNSMRTKRPLLNKVYTAHGLDSAGAFERRSIPTKPSTSFEDVFMAPSKRFSGPNQAAKTWTKRTALKAFDSQKSGQPPTKVVKPAQRQIVKLVQKTQLQATFKIKQKVQMKPAAKTAQNFKKSPVVLDVDTHSSAIRQLLKSPVSNKSNAVVLYRQDDEDNIPLIDLTEDSPPRDQSPGGQNPKLRQLVKTKPFGFQAKSVYNAESLGHQARRQSLATICPLGPKRQLAGHQARRQSMETVGSSSRPQGRKPAGHTTVVPARHPANRQSPGTVGPRRPSWETVGPSSDQRQLVVYPRREAGQDQRGFVVSQWKFRCFACSFQRLFFGPQEQPRTVEKAVRDHMHLFHHVSDAEAFLSRYLDSVNRCTVIEAFPGFKEPED